MTHFLFHHAKRAKSKKQTNKHSKQQAASVHIIMTINLCSYSSMVRT